MSFSWFSRIFCCQTEPEAPPNPTEEQDGAGEPLQDKTNDEEIDDVIDRQPVKNNENQTYFCCASNSKNIRDDQIDFCPPFWFKDLRIGDKDFKIANFLWRLCFVVTCLPLCYPCYVSRSIRRRRKERFWTEFKDNDKLNDELNRTILHREVTMKYSGIPKDEQGTWAMSSLRKYLHYKQTAVIFPTTGT